MADKNFGVKKIELVGSSGTPNLTSPTNLNLNAINVAISTDVTIGGKVQSDVIIGTGYSVGIGSTQPQQALDVDGTIRASTFVTSDGSPVGGGDTANIVTDSLLVTGGIGLGGQSASFSGGIDCTDRIRTYKDIFIVGDDSSSLVLDGRDESFRVIQSLGNAPLTLQPFQDLETDGVGIGTTNPQGYGLYVQGTTFTEQLVVSGVVTATSFSGSNTLKERTIVSGITTAIENNGIGNTDISGFKSYALMKVGLSTEGWLRIYTDSASRDADVSRSVGEDPLPGSGVIAEVVTTGISTTQIISPFVTGGNLDEPATTTIYASVKNLSGITTVISFDLTILQLEA